jgi:hypothetical protein
MLNIRISKLYIELRITKLQIQCLIYFEQTFKHIKKQKTYLRQFLNLKLTAVFFTSIRSPKFNTSSYRMVEKTDFNFILYLIELTEKIMIRK